MPLIASSSQEAQDTTLVASKSPPPGTGLFGSSWTGSNHSNGVTGPTTPLTTGSSLFANTPATPGTIAAKTNPFASYVGGSSSPFAANVTTASSAPKSSTSQSGGIFGGFVATSPALGSTTTQLERGPSGPGAAPSSSSTTGSLFPSRSGDATGSLFPFSSNVIKTPSGDPFGGHAKAPGAGNPRPGGIFALPVSTSSSTSDISTPGSLFGSAFGNPSQRPS